MNRLGAALVWLCVVVWLGFVAQGVLAYLALESTGSGFTRGSNRAAAFLRWETYALGAAVITSIIGRGLNVTGAARIVSRWPLRISGGFFALLIVSFLGLIVWMSVFG